MKKFLLALVIFGLTTAALFAQADTTAIPTLPSGSVFDSVLLWLGTAYAVYEVLALRIATVKTWSTVKLIFGWIHSILDFFDKKKV